MKQSSAFIQHLAHSFGFVPIKYIVFNRAWSQPHCAAPFSVSYVHWFQQSMTTEPPCHSILCFTSPLEQHTKLPQCSCFKGVHTGLSLVNYSQCIHSFLLNFAFQYFPNSWDTSIFIIPSHCFSKCGLVGHGRLAVHIKDCVACWAHI